MRGQFVTGSNLSSNQHAFYAALRSAIEQVAGVMTVDEVVAIFGYVAGALSDEAGADLDQQREVLMVNFNLGVAAPLDDELEAKH